MKIGVVTGVAWASRKVKELEGVRLCVVQPISADGDAVDTPLVVADPDGFGSPGDRVVYVTSADAAEVFPNGYAPVNASIVELVDDIV